MYITAGEKTDFFKGGSFRLFFTANTDLYLYPPGGNREATLLCEVDYLIFARRSKLPKQKQIFSKEVPFDYFLLRIRICTYTPPGGNREATLLCEVVRGMERRNF